MIIIARSMTFALLQGSSILNKEVVIQHTIAQQPPLREGRDRVFPPLTPTLGAAFAQHHNIHLAQKYNKNFVKKTEKSA